MNKDERRGLKTLLLAPPIIITAIAIFVYCCLGAWAYVEFLLSVPWWEAVIQVCAIWAAFSIMYISERIKP